MSEPATWLTGVFMGAIVALSLSGSCGAYRTKQQECSAYCHEHDGGVMRFDARGYECKCANLQAVKP